MHTIIGHLVRFRDGVWGITTYWNEPEERTEDGLAHWHLIYRLEYRFGPVGEEKTIDVTNDQFKDDLTELEIIAIAAQA